MTVRTHSIKYGYVITKYTPLTYFKISSNLVEGDNYLEGYVIDVDHQSLPECLETMESSPTLVTNLASKYSTVGIICNFQIESKHRGKGIGSDLVNLAINEFNTLNANAVILVANIHKDNSHLQNGLEQWYRNRGFETIAKTNEMPLMVLQLEQCW